MKLSNLSKVVGVGALTLSTAIMPLNLPASAQEAAPEVPGEIIENEDNGFDWGWLGLLGLIGLAGLAGKKRSEPAAYRDPNTVGTTGYRE